MIWWILLQVNAQSVIGMPHNKAVALIRKCEGTLNIAVSRYLCNIIIIIKISFQIRLGMVERIILCCYVFMALVFNHKALLTAFWLFLYQDGISISITSISHIARYANTVISFCKRGQLVAGLIYRHWDSWRWWLPRLHWWTWNSL